MTVAGAVASSGVDVDADVEAEVAALRAAARAVRERCGVEARIGVLWGPGLGPLPDFGAEALVEAGRPAYEGIPLPEVVRPVRIIGLAGAGLLVVTGACTAVDPALAPGDLVLLEDQINLTGGSPLVGPNLDELGPRFPDMSRPFDPELVERASAVAAAAGIPLRRGVHAGVLGPHLETGAELAMLRTVGADVAGMSLVAEVIAARHMSLRVLGLAVVYAGSAPGPLPAPAFAGGVARLASLVRQVVKEIARS